jgi:hypothetical protein
VFGVFIPVNRPGVHTGPSPGAKPTFSFGRELFVTASSVMVRLAPLQRTQPSYESVFKSSVPQRPTPKTAAQLFGGRPVGPTTYNPTNNLIKWENDVERMNASFKSKTKLNKQEIPITHEVDWMEDPFGAMHAVLSSSPSAHGHGWPAALEPREPVRDPGLDFFSSSMDGQLSFEVGRHPRKYAGVFQSRAPRLQSTMHQEHDLGPGAYDTNAASVSVKDPKRANATFKSQTTTALFDAVANQPPDAIQPIQSAILCKHWTSSGCPFSTRERFPRERRKWKD